MRILLLSLLVGMAGHAWAQKSPVDTVRHRAATTPPQPADLNRLLPALTPKSPMATALGRYGEYPVSLYTGLPSIEIPIHQFNVGSLNVPVKLTYHASGLKVNDLASWVGMGWSLQTGGMVSRSVMSRPDEQASGRLGQPIPDPNSFYNASCVTPDAEQQMNWLSDNQIDSQRDLFTYATPSASNTFMLVPAPPGYVSLQPGPVSISAASGLSSFTVIDERGIRYQFADREVTNTNTNTANAFAAFTSAWYLSEITSPTTTDKARYTYSTAQTVDTPPEPIDSWVVNANLDEVPAKPSGVTTGIVSQTRRNGGSSVAPRLPASIDFPGGRLRFVLETTARADFSYGLDYIDVLGYNPASNDYSLIKRIDLVYVNKARTDGSLVAFLDQVRLLENDGITLVGAYQLTYNADPLPAAASLAKDYWGYYNGQTNNTTLIPTQTFTVNERSSNPSPTTFPIGDADRAPVEAKMTAWVIEQIRYPTGGSSRFTFETNRYQDPGGATRLAGGLRLLRLENYTEDGQLALTKRYTYGVGGSGRGTFRSQLTTTYASTLQLNYYQPSGTSSPGSYNYTTYSFTSSPTYPLTPDEGSPVTYPEVAEYTEDGLGHSTGRTVHQFRDEAVDGVQRLGSKSFVTSRRWDRGQLSHQFQYAAGGQLLAQTDYEYTTLASGQSTDFAGVLVQESLRQIGSISQRAGTACNDPTNQYLPSQSYRYYYGLVKPATVRETLIDAANTSRTTVRLTETDYTPTYFLPRETRRFVEGTAAGGNRVLGERWSYPTDFGRQIPDGAAGELLAIRALQARNLFLPIETIRYQQDVSGGAKTFLTGSLTTYQPATISGLPTALPYQLYLAETLGTSSYTSSAERYQNAGGTGSSLSLDLVFAAPRLTMTSYDGSGNLTAYQVTAGARTDYTYATYLPAAGVPFSVVASQTLNAGEPTAQPTAYGYTIPLLGLASQTDPRNVTTTYRYDAFGRLKTILDKDSRVLTQYTYHYATPQP